MDPLTVILGLGALLLVLAFVAQPFVSGASADSAPRAARRSAAALRRRADLLAERNRIYAALRDLDFDYRTNKVSDDDYARQRHALVAEGVEVLQMLDTLPAPDADDDPVEHSVQGLQRGDEIPAAAGARRHCPNCGAAARPGDRFCGECGARLSAAA